MVMEGVAKAGRYRYVRCNNHKKMNEYKKLLIEKEEE